MSENAGNNQLITVDSAKSQISIALTKVGLLIQSFHTRKASLVMNEDPENLEKVSQFIADKKKAKKVIEENHSIIKKPFFEAGKCVDKGKNEMIAMLDSEDLDVETWYNAKMDEIARKKREQDQKEEQRKSILTGVESNILAFATQIAGCKTRKDLTDVERLINLEKSPSRANKYGELHEFAIGRYDEVLLPIIKEQKVKVDEYEKLQDKLQKENDAAKADEIKAQLEEKDNEILQNQVKVQEAALNQPIMSTGEVQEVLPDITKAGSNIVCEIVDEKIVFKKHRELLNVDLKLLETKKLASTLRDAGAFGDKDELIFDGMKFTIQRRYK